MALTKEHLRISYALATVTVAVVVFSSFLVFAKHYPAPPLFASAPSGAATAVAVPEDVQTGEAPAAPAPKPRGGFFGGGGGGGGGALSLQDIGVTYGDVSVGDVIWEVKNPIFSGCKLSVTGTVNNTGESALDGNVVCTVYDSTDKIVATLKNLLLGLPPESVSSFEMQVEVDCALNATKYKCDFLTPPCDY
ncbi:MAG: hypothetical protein V1839_00630 [archaeon]